MSTKYVSGRVKELKVGLSSYSENRDALSVIGNANIGGIVTATSFSGGEASVTGNLEATEVIVEDNIRHKGDTDTYIEFTADQIRLIAGGKPLIHAEEGTIDTVIINDGSNDLDFRVEGQNDEYQIFSDGSTDSVGIGSSVPTAKLDVAGTLKIAGGSTFTGVSTFNDDVQFKGALYDALWDKATSKFKLYDLTQIAFGDGNDLQIYSDGTYGIIKGNDTTKITGITELGVSGVATFSNLKVTGVSTYQGDLDIESSVLITGITTIGGLVDINAGAQANTLKVEDLTDNRVVIAGTGGELEDSANLTFDGTTFNVGSGVTIYQASGIVSATSFYGDGSSLTGIDASALKFGGVVKAQANQSGVVVTGVLTATSFSGTVPSASLSGALPAISGANLTNLPTGINTGGTSGFTDLEVSGTLSVGGTSIFNSPIVGVATFSGDIDANGNLDVDGQTDLDDVVISGVSTFSSAIDANGGADISGGTGLTASSAKISDLTNTRVVYAGAGGELQDSGNLTFNGTTLSASAFAGDGSQITNLPGIDTAGGSVFTNILSSGINTLGKGVNGITYLYHADSLKFTTTGIGVSVASGTGKTAYIEGPEEIWIDPHPSGVGTTSGIVRIRGDLYVDGTEVIVDVDKLEIGDFQIGIATTAGTNAVLDGAGIGIGSTGIRKYITWNNATSALMSSENWNLASGKHYEIAGTDVLTATTLGSGVVNSSLTSVGTLSALTVSGASVFNSSVGVNTNLNVTGVTTLGDPTANNTTFINASTAGDAEGNTLTIGHGSGNNAGLTVQSASGYIGSLFFTDTDTGKEGGIQYYHTLNALKLYANETEYLALDSNGVSVSNGSLFVTDKITHTGDTNTHLRFPAADTFTVETGGSERFRVVSSGAVVAGVLTATDVDSTSDIRLKTNIQVIENPLAKVIQIEGVSFNWKEDNRAALGVIADQVQEILPELVHGNDPKTVNYNGLIGLLIEAVKEQQIQIDELKSKLP